MRILLGSILLLLAAFPLLINAKPIRYDFYPTSHVTEYLEKSNQTTYFKKGIKNKDLTNAECLAYVLYTEARGEPDEGIVAVAFVVRNRSFKNDLSLCDVVREKDQFSPVIKKLYDQYDRDAWLYSLIVSSNLVDNQRFNIIASPIGEALYFNSLETTEQGIMGKGRLVRKIGHHYFYK